MFKRTYANLITVFFIFSCLFLVLASIFLVSLNPDQDNSSPRQFIDTFATAIHNFKELIINYELMYL